MHLRWTVAAVVPFLASATVRPAKRFYDTHDYYVLEHDPHSQTSLTALTSAINVELIEQAGELQDHWLVRVPKSPEHSEYRVLRRSEPHRSSMKSLHRQVVHHLVKRAPPPPWVKHGLTPQSPPQDVAEAFDIVDPLFAEQWHLVNQEYPEHMMNVTPVWEMGYTGKGVLSSLIDDGLDYTSDDIKDNFDEDNSYDFNTHDDLPTPRSSDDHHGTRCAGQIAAGKNSACGVGIAYNSKVAGVRILSGPITDVDEAAALNYGYQNVSIYSCSWGPRDDGKTMDGAPHLIRKALLNGINKGRGGKGSIYVFASGNGGRDGDQCNFDGYTNSIYSVTVAAVDYKGLHSYYSEPCAANMVVAYSSGSNRGKGIVTTDLGINECTKSHGGTSAAAPNAVGVFALALEARPDLTWRDIQHLSIQSARLINPTDPDWELTHAGRKYSYKYGFGVLDAGLFVEAALAWSLVKPQAWYKSHTVVLNDGTAHGTPRAPSYTGGMRIPKDGVGAISTIKVTEELFQMHNLEALEHINVKVWISHERRGDVEVDLISPNGVRSMLAGARSGDDATTGFPGWTFMTIKHWGEVPYGTWSLRVSDAKNSNKTGAFLGWNIHFWGSSIDAEKATLFQIPLDDTDFPPNDDLSDVLPTSTKVTLPSSTSLPNYPEPPHTPGWEVTQLWFIGIGASLLFGIGIGTYFYQRRQVARGHYAPLGDNAGGMALADFGHTRELQDDDEDDH